MPSSAACQTVSVTITAGNRWHGRTLAKELLAGLRTNKGGCSPGRKASQGRPGSQQGESREAVISSGCFSLKGLLLQHVHSNCPEVGTLENYVLGWGPKEGRPGVCTAPLTWGLKAAGAQRRQPVLPPSQRLRTVDAQWCRWTAWAGSSVKERVENSLVFKMRHAPPSLTILIPRP